MADRTYFGLARSPFVHADRGTPAPVGGPCSMCGYGLHHDLRMLPTQETFQSHDRVPRDKVLCKKCSRSIAARTDVEE